MKGFQYIIISIFSLLMVPVAFSGVDYQPPQLNHSESWTMIMLPDTQTYTETESNHGILHLMTGWISDNIKKLNIKLVISTGDLVQSNDSPVIDSQYGTQTSRTQWLAISSALDRLDGKVPYILASGNHDYGYHNMENRKSYYDQYFPYHKNLKTQEIVRSVAKDINGKPTLENAAYEFTSPHGREFLFINLEFAPRDSVLDWAAGVLKQKKYQNHTSVLLTHSFLNSHNQRFVKENFPLKDANYGQAIWEKLVYPAHNIQIVLSGHIAAPDDFVMHTAARTDSNSSDTKVHQMAFNAQAMGGGWFGNGGDGWLRIYEFLPDKKTVKVTTFSPLFAVSPSTRHLAWSREKYNHFSFELE